MNILKNKLDLAKGKVEVFATNLQTPSHMEWTSEGRLLVSETSAGRVTDITDGGKITEKNIVTDELEGPSSIVPLEDGRIYICETFSDRITNIGKNSDNTDLNFEGFIRPYSIVFSENHLEVVVRESNFSNKVTKINLKTGEAKDKLTHIPALPLPGLEGLLPMEQFNEDFEQNWSMYSGCSGWKATMLSPEGEKYSVSSSSIMGTIVFDPDIPTPFLDLVDMVEPIATGLDLMGGMIQNKDNFKLYVTQPKKGTVMEIDPFDSKDYRFTPPVIQGLNFPTCIRFSPDNKEAYVCSAPTGTIWRFYDFN